MTAHVHAALMAQYAQDALTTDKPWELWEWSWHGETQWKPLNICGPAWLARCTYRRKPKRQWYRVALFVAKDTSWTVTADCEAHEKHINSFQPAARWLTDRIYYDVE